MALLLDMFLLVVSTHAQSEHPRCPSKGLGNLSNMVYHMQLGHVRNPEGMWSLAGDAIGMLPIVMALFLF